MIIMDLEMIDQPGGMPTSLSLSPAFWQPVQFDQLASEQGVYPVEDWTHLTGDWPKDADFDEFLESVRQAATN